MPDPDGVVGDHEQFSSENKWGEILIGFESKNKFEIADDQGNPIDLAAEQGGGFGAMLGLADHCRKATIHIYDREERGRHEPFGGSSSAWRCSTRTSNWRDRAEVHVADAAGGRTRRRRDHGDRRSDAAARSRDVSPVLPGQEVGKIGKQWGGVLQEMFTDADTFGVGEIARPAGDPQDCWSRRSDRLHLLRTTTVTDRGAGCRGDTLAGFSR